MCVLCVYCVIVREYVLYVCKSVCVVCVKECVSVCACAHACV